jgi:hypothetical protein
MKYHKLRARTNSIFQAGYKNFASVFQARWFGKVDADGV